MGVGVSDSLSQELGMIDFPNRTLGLVELRCVIVLDGADVLNDDLI